VLRELFGGVTFLDVADMATVAVLLSTGMVLLRRTRARMALIGLGILGVVYLVARQVGLRVTAGILQGFFAVLVIVVVVVFQEDLRRFFEQIASWGLRRRSLPPPPGITDQIARVVARLASTRTGALLVFPGSDDLGPHLEGGIAVRGEVSEPLLLSLFDASSPGHDGAVVIQDGMLQHFSVHLPLSTDHDQLGPGGTRHAAGLGLAERTDALCVIVSEERGSVSVAYEGTLRVLRGPEEVAGELRRFLQELAPEDQGGDLPFQRLRRVWKEAALSLFLAVLIWTVFVPGSSLTDVTRSVPVVVENLPPSFVLEAVEPASIEVTFRGRRRDVYLGNPGSLSVRLDALLVQLGRRTFQITPELLEHPTSLEVVATKPDQVVLSVRRRGASPGPQVDAAGLPSS
jgi:diadenylate cyclase